MLFIVHVSAFELLIPTKQKQNSKNWIKHVSALFQILNMNFYENNIHESCVFIQKLSCSGSWIKQVHDSM